MAVLGLSTQAHAEDCESIIALSKTVATTVQDKNAVEANSSAFCSEYAQAKKTGRSMAASASYKFLSASYGTSQVSEEEIASKYCSVSDNYSKRNDAYRQYVESISPNAYQAYEQCLEMARRDLKFKITAATLLPTELSVSVTFVQSIANAKASLSYNTSSGISCDWSHGAGPEFNFNSAGSTGLNCKRADASKKGYIVIRRTNSSEELALSWLAMNSQGLPIDVIADMQAKSLALSLRVAALDERINTTARAATASQTSTRQMIDTVDRRFTKLHLTQTCSPKNWLPVPTAGACPAGFTDTGLLTSYSAPGGPHGFGGNCRICYKVDP